MRAARRLSLVLGVALLTAGVHAFAEAPTGTADPAAAAPAAPPSPEAALESSASSARPPAPAGPSGRSCILGADGAVLYRPAGARCKGDPVQAAEPGQSPASVAGDAKPQIEPEEQPGPSRSSCMYGADGEVVYAPQGSKC